MDELKHIEGEWSDEVHSWCAPDGLTFATSGDELIITRKWLQGSYIFILGVLLAVDGVMLSIILGLEVVPGASIGSLVWFIFVFMLVVLLNYTILVFMFNKMVFTINRSTLRKQHRPLPWLVPWFGNKSIPTSHIKDIYAVEQTFRTGSGASTYYRVEVLLHDGTKKVLMGISDPFKDYSYHMWYMKEKIKRHLGM